MTDLFAQHLDLARRVARGIAAKLPRNVALEDLEQAALLGLHQWCTAHPDSSHPGWRGGLITRVRGATLDWLRTEDYLSRGARARGELHLVHLEDLSTDDGPSWQDTLGQFEEPSEYAREDVLRALSADMPARDRLLIVEAFGRGSTQAALAQKLGVSEPRIAQLIARALRTMRQHLEREQEIVAQPVARVQVLETPRLRVRDFKRELWLARRNALYQRMTPGMTMRGLARALDIPEATLHNWCGSTKLRYVLLDRSDPISDAVRQRGRDLIVAALRARGGSGQRAAPLLRITNTTLCEWRRRLIPEAPTCPSGVPSRVAPDVLVKLRGQRLSHRQIGKRVGLSAPAVQAALAKLGLSGGDPRRRIDVSVEACVKARGEGLSLRQLAQRFKCSIALVRKRLREGRVS